MTGKIRIKDLDVEGIAMNAIDILKKHEKIIKGKYHVKKIGIFGSFARSEAKEGSDIDVLVEFESGCKTFDNFMDLKFYLEDLFSRKVDLVTIEALRPQLKENILREVSYA
jgi:predicted nucleotidyltransferase